MPVAPSPAEIYRRAVEEGGRRLSASPIELLATGFNAGFTIVFGIALLALLHAHVEPRFGVEIAKIAGAAGFGCGLVFLVVSRAELFTENFFDPVASALGRWGGDAARAIVRLWSVILALNLVGAAALAGLLSVDGVLPPAAEEALRTAAEELAARDLLAGFTNALIGGAIVVLLSFLLQAVDTVLARMVVALLIGFLLALGPFSHVVVTTAHLALASFNGGAVPLGEMAVEIAVAVAGNLLGGIAFVSLTHIAQIRGD